MATQETRYDLPFGFAKAAVQVKGSDKSCTIVASTGTFTSAGHGYSDGDVVVFSSITTTTGFNTYTKYYVINSATNTFKISATSGGSAVSLTTDGSATVAKMYELRIRLANQIARQDQRNDTNYEGDDSIIRQTNLQSVSFTFDADSLPIGAHSIIFGGAEVTSSLPDSYTSAYAILPAAARTGTTVGFWGEGVATSFTSAGVQSTKTIRQWYPLGTLTLSQGLGQQTSNKPQPWQYTFNATEMAPTVDVMGVALPVTGSALIYLSK